MAKDGTGTSGVTNLYGEVFKGNEEETYPGLIVTDAAVIPTALGANPFATITALAERSVEYQAEKWDLQVSTKKNGLSLPTSKNQQIIDEYNYRLFEFPTRTGSSMSQAY